MTKRERALYGDRKFIYDYYVKKWTDDGIPMSESNKEEMKKLLRLMTKAEAAEERRDIEQYGDIED